MHSIEELKACRGVLAIDFDGRIAETKYPIIHKLLPNAKEVINKLKKDGFYIIIWTCRTGKPLLDAIAFLNEEGVEYDKVNENHPNLVEFYQTDCRKISADIYIDDKNIGEFYNWDELYNLIWIRMEEQSSSLHITY